MDDRSLAALSGLQSRRAALHGGGVLAAPGAVPYQREVLDRDEAAAWLGMALADPSEGALNLGAGFLIVVAAPGFGVKAGEGVRLDLA